MQPTTSELMALPLTSAQQGIFLEIARFPYLNAAYNIAGYGEIDCNLDITKFQRAVDFLVRRHPALRAAVFLTTDGLPQQAISDEISCAVECVDFRGTGRPHDAALSWMTNDVLQPFDLARPPLFRIALLRLTTRRWYRYAKWHHIIVDGMSVGLLHRQLGDIYTSLVNGESVQCFEDQTFYSYVQRQNIEEEPSHVASKKYWAELYSDPPPRTSLSLKHVQGDRDYGVHAIEYTLNEEQVGRLRRLVDSIGVSLSDVLISSAALLISRLSGVCDLSIGLPVHGRTRKEWNNLVAVLANVLPLRLSIDRGSSIAALIRYVSCKIRDALKNQSYRYEGFRRHTAHTYGGLDPFSIVVNILRWRSEVDYAGAKLSNHTLSIGPVQDLSLTITDRVDGDALRVQFRANSALFEPWELESIGQSYSHIVCSIAESLSTEVKDVSLMSASLLRRLYRESSADSIALHEHQSVQKLFERSASDNPDAIAVVDGNRRITYRELSAEVNGLSESLISAGVRKGDLVGIYLDRSSDAIVAILGILKAGGAYVPLDTIFPEDRLRYIANKCQLRTVVTQLSLCHDLSSIAELRAIIVEHTEKSSSVQTLVPVEYGDLAYVIFTSGSTGQPKGVEVSHGSLVNLIGAFTEIVGPKHRKILPWIATLTFDIAGLEILLPLCTGGTVLVISRSVSQDPCKLLEMLDSHQLSCMQATPATWYMLTATGWRPPNSFLVLCGGEAMTQSLAAQLNSQGARVLNAYGPTETTIYSTVHVQVAGQPILIGKPIQDTRTYVLDDNSMPLPVGCVGELYIGGKGVALGYHREPELTRKQFLDDPFCPGHRIYKTGDLVRYRPDGNLEFVGRRDGQTKIRGFRVELGEIESVLDQCQSIRECVVITKGLDLSRKIIAYVVVNDQRVEIDEVKAFLRSKLPEYMLPSKYVVLAQLPRLPNGKIDRNRLPDSPEHFPPSALESKYRSELELEISKIFASALNLTSVASEDDFFDLGGDSLTAIGAVMVINQNYGLELVLDDLFQASTPRDLSDKLGTAIADRRP